MSKFKVGDEVVVIEPSFTNWHGKLFKVVRISDRTPWLDIKGSEFAFDSTWIRKATKLEKALK